MTDTPTSPTPADDRHALADMWPDTRPLVGMVHLPPLPGAPRWGGSMDAVVARAVSDARALAGGGMDGVLVENFLDAPFHGPTVGPETVAAMARIVAAVVEAVSVPVGVNVLRNDAAAALAVAVATGARFIRVNVHTGTMFTDQGMLEGRAADTLRRRRALGASVAILADVLVKHATPPEGATAPDAARDTWHRGLADGLIVSGTATGAPADAARLRAVRAAVPEALVWVGSGVTPDTVAGVLAGAHGAIVGTSLAVGGRAGAGIDAARVAALVAAARG